MSKLSCRSNISSHHFNEESQCHSAKSLGAVTWNEMFKNDELELPETSFMNHLRQTIPHEQVQQITDDTVRIISNEEEGFCNENYYTLKDAKKLYLLP